MADDLSRLGEWNAALIRDEGHDNPMTVAELTERMREWLVGEYRARIFVCDGVDTGYALYRELREFVHLRQFYIAPEHRRRGIGAAALSALREHEFPASKRVLVEAMSWNAAALAFWRACGLRPLRRAGGAAATGSQRRPCVVSLSPSPFEQAQDRSGRARL